MPYTRSQPVTLAFTRCRRVAASPVFAALSVAFAVRLVVAICFPNVIAADEIFQFLEQAHRLVFGNGVVPWEFQVGLRNWLIPLLLTAPMALVHLMDPSPLAGLVVIRVLLCAASLPIVWCGTRWGERFSGPSGGWIAGLMTALWPDLWLMAPHPMEEVLAADLLVPALYLAEIARSLKQVAWAGFLLGLIFAVRLQLAPAVAIIGIALCGGDLKRWRIALLAASLPVVAAGMLDWFTWGQPFRSFWLNIYINIFLHIAQDSFGARAKTFFLFWLNVDWSLALPLMVFLAWRGARHLPVAGMAAAAIVLTHSLVAHKEFRFIFPAIAIIVPLAGTGLAGLAANLSGVRQALLTGALLVIPYTSPLTYMLLYGQTNSFQLFHSLALQPPCLISLQGWDREFLPIPPVFDARTRFTGETINRDGGAIIEADAIVADESSASIPAGFTLQSCTPGSWIPFNRPGPRICLWRRPVTTCPVGPVAPFSIVFPAAAKKFIVRDWLTD